MCESVAAVRSRASVEEFVGIDLLRSHQRGEAEAVITAVFIMAHGRQT